MNIVFLLGGYLLLFLICVLSYFVCWRRNSPVAYRITEVLSRYSPPLVSWLYIRVFEKRNPIVQLLYGTLVLAGHAIVYVDILPHLMSLDRGTDYVHPPLVLWAINTALYVACCRIDPGAISSDDISQNDQNEDDSASTVAASSAGHGSADTRYPYDSIVYKPNNVCPTCHIVKPSRSKHCRVCDFCVARFDHHCIWTNSCIGARNHKHFLLLLASLIVMCANAAYMCIRTLYLIVIHRGLFAYRYRDEYTGEARPVTGFVLAQFLFMEYPRIFFLGSSMLVLVVLVGVFLTYHVYLACINMTTNEFYKYNALPDNAIRASRKHYDKGCAANLHELLFGPSHRKAPTQVPAAPAAAAVDPTPVSLPKPRSKSQQHVARHR